MTNDAEKKLPIADILKDSCSYFRDNLPAMALFSLTVYALGTAAFYSWKTMLFLPLMVAFYVLWSAFFRFYFQRKPYFLLQPIIYSMVPSTKIVVLGALLLTLLVVLPFAPLFLPISPEWMDDYAYFLQRNMQESDLVDAFLNVLVILLSPVLFYRPALAWIAALTGRSGSLSFAWGKTKGNYWEFLLLAVIVDLSSVFIYKLVLLAGGNLAISFLFLAPLTVYFNVVMAGVYNFFYQMKKGV